MTPFLKTAKSVVPPPISISATPASFSSSLKTASDEANGYNVNPVNSNPAFFTQRPKFLIDAACPTTI